VKEKVRTQMKIPTTFRPPKTNQAGVFEKYGILDFKSVSDGFLLAHHSTTKMGVIYASETSGYARNVRHYNP
jgi:hypothetical protein